MAEVLGELLVLGALDEVEDDVGDGIIVVGEKVDEALLEAGEFGLAIEGLVE